MTVPVVVRLPERSQMPLALLAALAAETLASCHSVPVDWLVTPPVSVVEPSSESPPELVIELADSVLPKVVVPALLIAVAVVAPAATSRPPAATFTVVSASAPPSTRLPPLTCTEPPETAFIRRPLVVPLVVET